MKLYFQGGKTSEIKVLKETKKYLTFRACSNTMKYRLNKETGEVQDGTYHKVLQGLWVE